MLLGLPSREAFANAETEEGEEGEEEEEEAAADSVASSPSMLVGDFRPPKRKLALQLPEDEDRVTGSALSAQSRESQHCARLGFGICSFLGLPCTASSSDSLCVERVHVSCVFMSLFARVRLLLCCRLRGQS